MFKGKGLFELSTGREFWAPSGILGISPRPMLASRLYGGRGIRLDEKSLTHAERIEISEFMIALWLEWADRGDPAAVKAGDAPDGR